MLFICCWSRGVSPSSSVNQSGLLVVCGVAAEGPLSSTYGLRTSHLLLHVIVTSLLHPKVSQQETITSVELSEYYGYNLHKTTPMQIQYKVLWTSTCDTTATEWDPKASQIISFSVQPDLLRYYLTSSIPEDPPNLSEPVHWRIAIFACWARLS